MTWGGALLGVHGVAADEQAVERQRPEQRPGGQGLVLAVGDRPLGDRHAGAGPEGGDDVQGRAARGAVEGAAQRLAVDGEDPVARRPEVVEEGLEAAREGGGVEQAEDAAEGVVARQAVLQAQEFPQERLPILRELREVHAALRPADRRHQRDRQDIEQLVALRIPPPRVGDLSKRVDQSHGFLLQNPWQNPNHTQREAPAFKCDSPVGRPERLFVRLSEHPHGSGRSPCDDLLGQRPFSRRPGHLTGGRPRSEEDTPPWSTLHRRSTLW